MSAHDPLAKSYDAVPYESKPLHPSHPDHMAVVAHLVGLAPPGLRRCRVLEIGCATGGNVIPMAVSMPEASFTGVDISPAQISTGTEVVRALGLGNVELLAASITDVEFAAGSFDYVVCHGVWSWVPAEVQEGILAAIARVLTPRGIAYVSYNTYPGWHMRGMVRDMLLYHLRDVEEPAQRIAAGREFLGFLHESARDRDSAFVRFLGEERHLLGKASDTYLFHEHLERDNRPVWFHEFAARVRDHGLRYVAEAVPADLMGSEFPTAVRERVEQHGEDPIVREQHFDFLRNRMFRRSLLCRADVAAAALPPVERMEGLLVGSPVRPVSAHPDLFGEQVESFAGPGELRVSVGHPWLKCAFALLAERWPRLLSLAELEQAIEARRGVPVSPEELLQLRQGLLACYTSSLLKLHLLPSTAVRDPGEQPRASRLARFMARDGNRVCNLRHELVEIGEQDRRILRLLDGEHDREAIARELQIDDAALQDSLRELAYAALLQG